MKRTASTSLIILLLIVLVSWISASVKDQWTERTTISEVLLKLGDKKPSHYRAPATKEEIKKGFDLITKGQTTGADGKKSKRISKFFQCTDCHNIQREDPILTQSNPEARLAYAEKNNLPFLQGTTLWGIVNRESWYNGDYIKKYGDLVLPTNDTLINAIALCCYECAKGRHPEKWEVEAILAYLYSIEVTLGDLDLTEDDYSTLASARQASDHTSGIELVKSKYLQKSPATFLDPLYGEARKYGETGNPSNGKLIYERSCVYCHHTGGVTTFELNKEKLDYKFLKKHLKKDGQKSLYTITRAGTYSKPVYKPYMPNYTEERMSIQQLEDLVAYINEASK